jgi:hypothetical protein
MIARCRPGCQIRPNRRFLGRATVMRIDRSRVVNPWFPNQASPHLAIVLRLAIDPLFPSPAMIARCRPGCQIRPNRRFLGRVTVMRIDRSRVVNPWFPNQASPHLAIDPLFPPPAMIARCRPGCQIRPNRRFLGRVGPSLAPQRRHRQEQP